MALNSAGNERADGRRRLEAEGSHLGIACLKNMISLAEPDPF